jgi:hypothetical protein
MPVSSPKLTKVPKGKKNIGRTAGDKLSLAPLEFEAAVRAALGTGKAPRMNKKSSKKGKK